MGTNWKGMQIPGQGKTDKRVRPGDTSTRHLSMGSWHANLSKGGQRLPDARSASKTAGKAKKKFLYPPPDGWKA